MKQFHVIGHFTALSIKKRWGLWYWLHVFSYFLFFPSKRNIHSKAGTTLLRKRKAIYHNPKRRLRFDGNGISQDLCQTWTIVAGSFRIIWQLGQPFFSHSFLPSWWNADCAFVHRQLLYSREKKDISLTVFLLLLHTGALYKGPLYFGYRILFKRNSYWQKYC